MFDLLDGECKGSYLVHRAPLYLRAVKDANTGVIDVLDQLEDSPSETEIVYVYKLEGEAGFMFLDGTNKGRRWGGRFATGQYRKMPDVDGQTLRDNPS